MSVQRIAIPLFAVLAALASHTREAPPSQDLGLKLTGEFLIPPKTPFPDIGASSFGAISGLTTLPGGCELLAISDDDRDPRMYRLGLTGAGTSMRVQPSSTPTPRTRSTALRMAPFLP